MPDRQSQGIKELIREFPAVATVLEEFGIECATCTVGICQLKDVLEIHSLPETDQRTLMSRIEAEIYPERQIRPAPCPVSASRFSADAPTLSSPIAALVREHTFIQRFIALAPHLAANLNLKKEDDQKRAGECVDFIVSYADALHHGKEEDILFSYFDTSEDIFKVIYEDHSRARALVREMREGIAQKDTVSFSTRFLQYQELLKEHINKEDAILFPWLDRRLEHSQKLELEKRFRRADEQCGIDQKKYERFVQRLEDELA